MACHAWGGGFKPLINLFLEIIRLIGWIKGDKMSRFELKTGLFGANIREPCVLPRPKRLYGHDITALL
jgi:hypothetical protein